MHRLLTTIGLSLVTFAAAAPANAMLRIGNKPSTFAVADPSDRSYQFSTLTGGGPALIVYVDRDGSEQNTRIRQRLQKLREKEPQLRGVRVVPIVDVSEFNHWPKRGFAKDALRDEAKELGYTVFADWQGVGRGALSAKSGVSNLILLDKNGRVSWASAGQLTTSQEDALIRTIHDIVR
jgi:hypothetical protein